MDTRWMLEQCSFLSVSLYMFVVVCCCCCCCCCYCCCYCYCCCCNNEVSVIDRLSSSCLAMIAVIGNNCPRLFEKCLWNLSQSPLNSCSNNSTIFFHLEILLCWTAFCCGDQCLTGGILFSPWYHS